MEHNTETVPRMETGFISPTLERLEQFSKLYDCPVIFFFKDDSESTNSFAHTLADNINPLRKEERSILFNFII
jgi:transcriptional regulator with XRE-family HTH domain